MGVMEKKECSGKKNMRRDHVHTTEMGGGGKKKRFTIFFVLSSSGRTVMCEALVCCILENEKADQISDLQKKGGKREREREEEKGRVSE